MQSALESAFTASNGDHDWTLSHPWASRLVPKVPLKPGCQIIDIAAGTGSLAVPLAATALKRGLLDVRVVAVDIDDKPLALLRANAARCGMPCAACTSGTAGSDTTVLCTLEQDALSLPFPDGTFDVATSVFGVVDTLPAARELARVLKPGGTALVMHWARMADGQPGVDGRQVLADAGLHVLSEEEHTAPMNYIGLINDPRLFDAFLRRLVSPEGDRVETIDPWPFERSKSDVQRDFQILYDLENPVEDIAATCKLILAQKM